MPDRAEVLAGDDDGVGAHPLVCHVIVPLTTHPPGQEHPLSSDLTPAYSLMDHVARPGDTNTGPHGLVVTSPVHMPHPTITADLLDPHGVMVHNLSSLGGPLLTS